MEFGVKITGNLKELRDAEVKKMARYEITSVIRIIAIIA